MRVAVVRVHRSPTRSAAGVSAGRPDGTVLIVEFGVLGGILERELFVPTPRTLLVIRCDRGGEITVRIAEGKSSAV